MRHSILAGLLLAGVSGFATSAAAQVWTGTNSSDWFTAGNWTPAVPTAATDAAINTQTPNPTVINAAGAVAKGVSIGTNAGQTGALTVTGAGRLAVGADALTVGDFGAGTLNIDSGGKVTVAAGGFAVLGNDPGGSGTATVTGAGSSLTADTLYLSADASTALFTVSNGGALTSASVIDIGDFSGQSNGTLTVTGVGSQSTAGSMQIGTSGHGTFNLLAGAHASGGFVSAGIGAGSVGAIKVDGAGSVFTTNTLTDGNAGSGQVQVLNGGVIQSGIASLAASGSASGIGSATVDGAGSQWTSGNFLLGSSGGGTVNVTNGGKIVSTLITAGPAAFIGNGTFNVTGVGSSWKISGVYSNMALGLGRAGGTAALNVTAGGVVTIDTTAPLSGAGFADLRLGAAGTGVATITVDGAGSVLTSPYNTYLGYASNSTGTLNITNGGVLNSGYGVIGLNSDATTATTDSVTVAGAGSQWNISDTPTNDPSLAKGLTIGSFGRGVLTIRDGGAVTLNNPAAFVSIGGGAGSTGVLNIGGPGGGPAAAPGTLNAKTVIFASVNPGPLTVNFNHTSSNYVFAPQLTGGGPGAVNVLAGTTIFTADNTYTGSTTISSGATLQLGNAGTTGSLTTAVTDNGALVVNHSAAFSFSPVISGSGSLAQIGAGTLTLTGNSTFTGGVTIASGSNLTVGNIFTDGSITSNVSNAGTLVLFRTANGAYGGQISGVGAVQKTGNGTLTLNGASNYSGGTTVANGRLLLGASDRLLSTGALTVQSPGTFDLGGFNQTVGDLIAPGGTIAIGAGQLTAGAAANTALAAQLTGTGAFVKQGAGTMTVTGTKTFSGATTISAGRMDVNGSMAASSFDVLSAATLGGSGAVGQTTVESGGILAGQQGQTLTLASLNLKSGAKVNVGLGAPGTTGLFAVTGNLTLDGVLNVSNTGGFGAGLYRLMTYGGALTDNTLDIGATPSGTAPSELTVQTSVAGQVNLIYVASPLSFWNGTTLAPANTIVGGAGTWSIGPTNWTNAPGSASGAWNSGFAIFAGSPGQVTIDNGPGQVSAAGLQFAVSGYSVGGGPLALSGLAPIVRVGDGSAGGAAYTATISSVITGTGGLNKTDLGTLTLSGANTFTGGATVSGGTLNVSANSNLGDAAGSVTLDGGVLNATAGFASGRTINIASASGLGVGAGTLNLTGGVTGAGALAKTGSGILRVGGASSYSGALTVTGGALQVDATFGGSSVAIQSGTSLSGAGSIAGATTVASGGALVGVQGQTLTMGSLALGSGSLVNVTLAAPGAAGLFNVTGNLTLDGTLNVTKAPGFGAGIYRIFDYGGALTNNGLDLGTPAAGTSLAYYSVQTSVAHQVNLVFNPPAGPFLFWDGDGVGSAANGKVDGGAGTWTTTSANFTDADGLVNAAMIPQPGFVVFEAAPGTVTVDNTAGPVSVTGMQFASSGYLLTGGAITLADPDSKVRVGDGSVAGAGYVATIAAPLTGAGALEKTDLGTLTLTGANTYAGGTIITGGTLVGSATSFSVGAITDNAALVINQAADASFANPINGTGTFTKTGAGTLTLTGTSNLAGATTVAGGRLAVNGSLGSSVVTVAGGATLSGVGRVGGVALQSGGTIAPGASIGVLNVAGNYAQASGSIYQVELDSTGLSDRINVGGNATIASGAILNVTKTDAAPYVIGTRYTVLNAVGAVTGAYALTGTVTSSVSPFIGLAAAYDAHNVYLDVTKIRSFASAGGTGNETAVAAAADDLPVGGVLATAIANLPSFAAAQGAFDQLSGEIHASLRGAMLEDGRQVRDLALGRLAWLDDRSEAHNGLWGSVVTGRRSFSADGVAARAHGSATTVLFGLDHRFGRVTLGVLGGFEDAGLAVEARSSTASLDAWHVGAYGHGDLGGGWALNGGAAFTRWSAFVIRTPSFAGFADAPASHDEADEGQVFGELNWTADLGAVRLQPFAGLGWSRLSGAAIQEQGASAALQGQAPALTAFSTKLGARLDAAWTFAGATVRPRASIAWEQGYNDPLSTVNLRFAGSPSSTTYLVAGPLFARSRADVDVGVDVSRGGFTLGVGYQGQYASRTRQDGFTAHIDLVF